MARAAVRGRLTWHVSTLRERIVETPVASTLRLEVEQWPGHAAGQHVDVKLTAADGYSTQRSYSIASAASGPLRSESLDITVQVVAGGEVSPFLAHDLPVGAQVEVRGPIGGWFVWTGEQAQPMLLIAGGSGIVPLMSMVRTRAALGSKVPCRLIVSVRTPVDLIYADELRTLSRDGAGVDVSVVYTREAPLDHPRRPGRIVIDDLGAHGWPASFEPQCFVCGPTGFVETVSQWLLDLGHEPSAIRTERFG